MNGEETAGGQPPDPVGWILRLAPVWLLVTIVLPLASAPLTNADTYFHLRYGREFLDHWSLRHPGHVSPSESRDWLPTQWASEIAMAKAEQWFGLAGVSFYSGAQILTLAVLLYVACRRQTSAINSIALTVCALSASLPSLSARPQVISYVFIVLTCLAWDRAHAQGKPPWWLIPLTWLWACLHGMWPLGIIVGLAAVAGLVLDRRDQTRTLLLHLAVPLLSALAAALTPVGPGLYSAVIKVAGRREFFGEWRPPDFTSPFMWFLALLIVIAVVPRLRSGNPTPWFAIAQIGLACAFAVYSARTGPVAACILAPWAALAVASRSGPAGAPVPRADWWNAGLASAAALLVLAAIAPSPESLEDRQPDWLDPAMSSLPTGTVVINDPVLGAYLIWRHPHLRVSAHGYADGFTDDELAMAQDAFELRPEWEAWVADTDASWAVLDPESPLAYGLETTLGWHVVQSSDDLELLQAPR